MTPESPAELAERLLHRGEPLLAFNAAREGLEASPADLRLRQLLALALARAGDLRRAHDLLESLRAEGHEDTETLALLARTHKDLATASRGADARERHLAAAFGLYAAAFERAAAAGDVDEAAYAGINAATLALVRGDGERAGSIAQRVLAACDRGGPAPSPEGRYWRAATRGEALLLLGRPAEAQAAYGEAASLGRGLWGSLASTRRQARLIASHLATESARALEPLQLPPVAVFTGHMVDAPGRESPRFPPAIESRVSDAISRRLESARPLAVYASAACGADLLCLEAAAALGIETHVVLPFPAEDFRRASVDFAPGAWGERFERAIAQAASVTITSDHRASGSAAAFEYANLVLTGMGGLRANLLDTSLVGIAACAPGAAVVPGGSAALAAHWRRTGVPVSPAWPSSPGEMAGETAVAAAPTAPDEDGFRHEMRALLFADAVGYSKLTEDQVRRYIRGFLGAIGDLAGRTRHPFEHVEVAGDGLYMVFRNPRDAGRHALELRELVRSFDRAAHGLPANLDLRIALHCGPVHCGANPITGAPIYTGPHTSRAARIEPITPPGEIYASGAFAAVSRAEGVDDFAFRYVGTVPLAKGYGSLRLYHLGPPEP